MREGSVGYRLKTPNYFRGLFRLRSGRLLEHKKMVALVLYSFALGNVASEASRVNEPVTIPQYIGVDQYMPDRAIFRSKSGWIIDERLTFREVPQYIFNNILIRMKFRDFMTHILFSVVTEHSQFGAVRALNGTVRPHPMESHGRIIEEVSELLLTTAQFLCDPAALGNLGP